VNLLVMRAGYATDISACTELFKYGCTDRIPPMPQPTLVSTPIHGDYRKRGDKID